MVRCSQIFCYESGDYLVFCLLSFLTVIFIKYSNNFVNALNYSSVCFVQNQHILKYFKHFASELYKCPDYHDSCLTSKYWQQ